MNKIKKLLTLTALVLIGTAVSAQDVRTLETKVADLLARMPADNLALASRLMEDMYALGDEGRAMICEQIVPAGKGDDLRARYAVASLTAHLSKDSDDTRKRAWESQCIQFMKSAGDREVRSFFMRQLSLTGSDMAVTALSDYVSSPEICDDAVIVLQSIGSKAAASLLYSSLSEVECPCAAQVMVALAATHPGSATDIYMKRYLGGNDAEKAAALLAIASTGAPEAYDILVDAARAASFRRDPGGAVRALLLYAKIIGLNGEVKKMERIVNQVIDASRDQEAASQRLAAMSIITGVKGSDALGMLLEAADDPDVAIRGGALRLAAGMPGSDVTKKWINRYARVSDVAKPEILFMLGERGDELAVPLMMKALDDPSPEISAGAVAALARLQGVRAVDPLISWILKYDNDEGHRAAATALTTILDSTGMRKIAASLPGSKGNSTVTLIRLLAWSGEKSYFREVLPLTGSDDIAIRAAAISALQALASYDDQKEIIALLDATSDRAEVTELQRALLNAAMQGDTPAIRSALILQALDSSRDRLKLIPLLAGTGGEEALKRVAAEFENGDAITRDVCFDALSHWSDHSAAGALISITASGNKTFGRPAFDAYMRMVSVAPLPPERKLLMIKEIAPYAVAPDARAGMVAFAASLGVRQVEFFIAPYLSDPAEEVRNAALEALESLKLPEDEEIEQKFNGKDLTGWQDLVDNPLTSAGMIPKELAAKEKEAGFVALFNGKNLDGWIGNKVSYVAEEGMIVIRPGDGSGGNLYTEKEYSDFVFRFEFQLTPGANNGLGIRTPLEGDAAYVGMELQILDNTASIYANLKPYQYHGSVYGVIPARRGFLRTVGEWNYQEVTVQGTKVKVVLNGTVIVDGDIAGAIANGTMDQKEHPGLSNSRGHIGFLGHGSVVKFRNIRIREL